MQDTVSEELSDSQKTWKMKSPVEDSEDLEDQIEALIDLEGSSGMLVAVAPEEPDTPRKPTGEGRCEGSAEKLEQKKQFPLERFFGCKPGCKTAMEESDLRMRAIVKDGAILKTNGRGRPSEASKALQAARKNGETLIVASVAEYNLAVQKEAEYKLAMGMKHGLGGSTGGLQTKVYKEGMRALDLLGSGVVIGLNSNRKLAGAAKRRYEEGAATKHDMCIKMEARRGEYALEEHWKAGMVKLYRISWRQLQAVWDGRDEWAERMKTLKLGKGSTGTTAAKGTCSKGGRMVKKGGIGARRSGAGRKDHFKHLKIRVKAWLERERSMCHHVDKVDMVEEFMAQCEDELAAAQHEIESRLETAKDAAGEKKGEEGEDEKKTEVQKDEAKVVENSMFQRMNTNELIMQASN